MSELHVVPRGDVSLEQVVDLARTARWKIDRKSIRDAEGEEAPVYRFRPDAGSTVTLVKSAALHRDYFVVAAPDPERPAHQIRDRFPCYDIYEIRQALVDATSDQEMKDAFRLLGAAAPSHYDDVAFQALQQGLRTREDGVRLAAVVTAYHLGWAQLRPLVQQAKESDESDLVRSLSSNLLLLSTWSRE